MSPNVFRVDHAPYLPAGARRALGCDQRRHSQSLVMVKVTIIAMIITTWQDTSCLIGIGSVHIASALPPNGDG